MNNERMANYCESAAYTNGWLGGYNALVVDLNEGFNGNLPRWLLALIGGKKAVVEALKKARSFDVEDDTPIEPDYDLGETDGYDELLEEVVEAFEKQKIEMPTFLKEATGKRLDIFRTGVRIRYNRQATSITERANHVASVL